MKKHTIHQAFVMTLPILLGYVFVGIAFGLLLKEKGFGLGWSVAMSFFVYAGAMQFIGISFLVPHVSFIHVAVMTLLGNIRHLFYGLSFIEPFQKMKWKKAYAIHALSDETYSLLCEVDQEDTSLMLWICFLDQMYWICGSALGSLMGEMIHFNTTGIDFAMNALFIVIVCEQWLKVKNHGPALIGFGSSLIAFMLFGKDKMILPAMIGILCLLLLFRKQIEGSDFDE